MKSQKFKDHRKETIKIAKQLLYGEEVISKLKTAKTVGEINLIMVQARRDWVSVFEGLYLKGGL